jgi:hypothetical protein
MRLLLLVASLCLSAGTAVAADYSAAANFTDCQGGTDKGCLFQQNVLKEQWPQALAGHYPSQRNVAFCLADGCYGAVRPDPIMSCAWRIVIMASGARELEKSDRDNYLMACAASLSSADLAAAKKSAWDLFYAIYGRTPS